MSVLIAQGDYDLIVAHASKELPNEACGLIAGTKEGDTRTIEKVYLLTNTDASPYHFSLDPQEQLEAVRDMRSRGLTLLGNWHSHPQTPSRPSDEDIRLAYDPTASYLILSLANQEPVLRSFRIMDGKARQEELIIR